MLIVGLLPLGLTLMEGVGYGAMWAIVAVACVASVALYVVWARHSDTSFSKMLAQPKL